MPPLPLRPVDNPPVADAAARVAAGRAADVLPLFCFDPRFLSASAWGSPKTGAFRLQFLLESVADLKSRLRAVGSDLLVALGRPEDVIPTLLADAAGGATVLAQREVTSEEAAVEAAVARVAAATGARLELIEARCAVRPCLPAPCAGQLPLPAGLPAEEMAWLPSRVEELNAVVPPGNPQLSTPQRDSRGVLEFRGGEGPALERLRYYLWDMDLIAPWLAHGCLSPRTVYHEVRRYEAARGANKSTGWVLFELTWRDYFHFFALKHGNRIFFKNGVSGRAAQWADDEQLLRRWKEGRTGWPLVDANMRELAATGFMSNRGRQNVASFLALDLGLDWRRGADHFESLLLDYDVCSNWGNWVAAAGLTGGRLNKFNITKQASADPRHTSRVPGAWLCQRLPLHCLADASKDYDPQGEYIRCWVPELSRVPSSRIHEPWLMGREEQQQYGVQIGADYPAPIPSKFGSGERPGGYRQQSDWQGGGGRGSGGARGGARGRGSARGVRAPKPRSAYELYG
eukprot:scaffold15.g4234.t1